MRTFSLLGCGALTVFLFALCFRGTGEAQERVAPGTPRIVETSWAVGTIKTSDLSLAKVKTLLKDDAEGATVCDYALADIAGDGFYRLAVSVDYSGRRFCNSLNVISSDGATKALDVWNVEHIADVLVKDGSHSVLRVPQAITDYEGADCIAVIPMFYSVLGGSLVSATNDHLTDYLALSKVLHSTPLTDACAVVVADKVDRLLGDKTAGFPHAKSWMASSDPSLRRKALRVFEDIGDSDSQAALRVLALDKDPVVAGEAQAALGK